MRTGGDPIDVGRSIGNGLYVRGSEVLSSAYIAYTVETEILVVICYSPSLGYAGYFRLQTWESHQDRH